MSHRVGLPPRDGLTAVLQALAVALGSVLIVLTSLNQPYNQNEWQQVSPYSNPDLGVAITGTRQPPLEPLLGVLVQRFLGDGHLEQRAVPMISGIGVLLLMVVLVRRLGLGLAGVGALYFLATAPLFLRYSAYSRPYMLPVLLMLLTVLVGTRWLDTGRRRWLAAAAGAALLLPLSRVPEPTAFLAAGAAALGVAGLRGALPRARAWPLAVGFVLALASAGLVTAVRLASKLGEKENENTILDLSPVRAADRVPTGLSELWHYVLPLYAEWFPWWPLTTLVLVLGVALARARHRLLHLWFWWPLVLAPLAFLVAYHTINAFPLDIRHYRIRFATFWIPSLVVLVAVVTRSLRHVAGSAGAWLAPLLAVALVVGQLPTTWRVLTENDAVDFAAAGRELESRVPAGSQVLYGGPTRTGLWRQPFFGKQQFLTGDVRVVETSGFARGRSRIRAGRPVYLLLLDSECMSSAVCDLPGADWDGAVDGYQQVARFDRFTLYAPTDGQAGRAGATRALLALGEAFGPEWGLAETAAAARLLDARGSREQAVELVATACAAHPPGLQEDCRDRLVDFYGLGRLVR